MARRLRSALLAGAALSATLLAPARAEVPSVLVAARKDGALVKVTVVGRAAVVDVLVPGSPGVTLIPTQARGSSVSYVSERDEPKWRADVGVVDATTGKRGALTKDGESAHLLVSPDGRYRYVIAAPGGMMASLVRTDARGGNRKTLLAAPPGRGGRPNDVQLSGAGISPDGRTVYVARTPGLGASQLLAVDTTTGARRVIRYTSPVPYINNVVASPDGKTLAVTFSADETLSTTRVGLVPVTGGETAFFDLPGDAYGAAFTPDGAGVLLTWYGYPVDGSLIPHIWIGDVATRRATPVAGTDELFQAVPVA